ncbi:NUDIX domain-containing protein [Streptomyces albidoflavus]|uniref:NUDIX domain-containing protein n=1 Tax=Streptomyces albidoflavus TaxID=1886 RepID=UPI0033AB7D3B
MSAPTAQRPVVDVHIIVRQGGKILLSQRGGPYGYGQWHAPSGKVEPGEALVQAAVRELFEETGLRALPEALTLCHTVIHHQGDGTPDRIGFFYEAHQVAGEPENREPEKCLALEWHAEHNLPENLIPYPAAGLHGVLHEPGSVTHHNWPE